jgi:putative addiction module killer protein
LPIGSIACGTFKPAPGFKYVWQRLADGNPGDVKPVGEGVSELRIDYGPGYRVYFTQRRGVLVILLCGGDKRTQDSDIRQALRMARELED